MTNDPNAERLAEIDAREKTATKGPWLVEFGGKYYCIVVKHLPLSEADLALGLEYEDAVFCANARQDIPWMSARIKELESENNLKDRRIAALENAARCCVTCVYRGNDDNSPECTACRDSRKLYGHWVFDEKRFAPKGVEQ